MGYPVASASITGRLNVPNSKLINRLREVFINVEYFRCQLLCVLNGISMFTPTAKQSVNEEEIYSWSLNIP